MNRLLIWFMFILFVFTSFDRSLCQNKNVFTNPILAGFYPDPSVCRVGSDYYLVNSTFSYFPGITVFHSKDLVNWELIGFVLDRPEEFNLDNQGVSRGLFAPAIRYDHGTYYVTCTLVDIGGNFVVTAKDPAGRWSKPIWLPKINGIDPSLFFDDDGKAYLIYNSIPPDNKPLYQGHRTIRMYEFDKDSLKVTGEELLLVNGGVDITKKPVWIEAPHILKKDGLYYLVCAEGGTAEDHSEVAFRSSKVQGPYIPYQHNPILTQRTLDPKREHPITCAGHADLVETEAGDWWAVFLGCRPYPPVENNFYNTGRETFLAPVKWVDGWPLINPGQEKVEFSYPFPIMTAKAVRPNYYSGNFRFRDEFDSDKLGLEWQFLRTPLEHWYDLTTTKGRLTMKLRPESCDGNRNPSFLGKRQQHMQGSASVGLEFEPRTSNEKAGIIVFQNESHFYFLCQSMDEHGSVVQLFKSTGAGIGTNGMELVASTAFERGKGSGSISLKIDVGRGAYSFSYLSEPGRWTTLKDSLDARFLSTKIAGGFVGCMYGMYATSLGKPSESMAAFDWFEYVGDDDVYR